MKNQAVMTLTIILSFTLIPVTHLYCNAQQPNNEEKVIPVNEYSGGFTTYMNVGSFNGSEGDYIGIYLTTSSSNSNYLGVEVKIAGVNSGIIYDADAIVFTQTFELQSNDTYNITLVKWTPFYADLTIKGNIIIYHYPVPLTTNPPSPSPAYTTPPSHTPSPTLSPSLTLSTPPTPTTTSTAVVSELSWWVIVPLLLPGLFAVTGRHRKETAKRSIS